MKNMQKFINFMNDLIQKYEDIQAESTGYDESYYAGRIKGIEETMKALQEYMNEDQAYMYNSMNKHLI